MAEPDRSIVVCALYKFARLAEHDRIRQPLQAVMASHKVRGTLLLAAEGVNGTVAGSEEGIDAVLAFLNADDRLSPIECKLSYATAQPFRHSNVKLKNEIVTMGVEGIDPNQVVGTYVEPEDWNALISDPDVLVVDTRNTYEVGLGTFKGAVDPKTETFRDFPTYAAEHLASSRDKKIAMFCTGGIRCEKSTAFLKQNGFSQVYHLKGGILKYLETVPTTDTLWEGECYVFDERVTVDHRMRPGSYRLCRACRLPIAAADTTHSQYEEGVSCPRCFSKITEADRERFREREKQFRLARQNGKDHIGAEVKDEVADCRRRRCAKTSKAGQK
ncbi:hypothetical protein DIPPA_11019 [Diplonema papillatum]|nr:hypothetical protein DIPPA_11019 [Diplonema papillatum]